jgi:hypothetical protein
MFISCVLLPSIMSPEIHLPEMARPDEKNPITWAEIPSIHAGWLRVVAPQLGLDPQKLLLGDVLSSIVGDDENVFGFRGEFCPDLVELSRTSLFIRMKWEEETQELPEYIRNRIKNVHEKLETMDWTDESGFNKAWEVWKKEVRNFTKHQLALHKDFRDATQYDLEMSHVWSPYWREFMDGQR